MTLNQLRRINKNIKIKGITNKSFMKYGRIVTGYDFTEMIKYVEKKTPIPEEGILYVNSVNSMELLDISKKIGHIFFGEVDIQIGYRSGRNSKLNYLEYHKSNQILVAVTDLIVFVGKVQDIKEEQYDSSKAEIFFIPEGVAVELYSTALCSEPCKMEDKGFKSIIIQTRGTGCSLSEKNNEASMLHSKNKWIIAHSEASCYINNNDQLGLIGENIEVLINHEALT